MHLIAFRKATESDSTSDGIAKAEQQGTASTTGIQEGTTMQELPVGFRGAEEHDVSPSYNLKRGFERIEQLGDDSEFVEWLCIFH
jgi:hypothetical protein